MAAGAVSPPSQLVCEGILCPVQADTRFPFVSVLKTIRLQAGLLQAAAHTQLAGGGLGLSVTAAHQLSPHGPCGSALHWQGHRLELDRPGFKSQFWPACGPALVFDRLSDLLAS